MYGLMISDGNTIVLLISINLEEKSSLEIQNLIIFKPVAHL